jgi:adenylate cyclase
MEMTRPPNTTNMPSTTEGGPADWAELPRQRRALVVVDVVESVRLMQAHEDDVIDRWRRFVHEVRTKLLPACEGRMVKSLGDGMLLEFAQVRCAVAAAFQVQAGVAAFNENRPPDNLISLRIGLHVAAVVVDEIDVYGAGVNLVARLATLARPGELVASADLADQLIDGHDAVVEDLGECFLKHLDEPVRAARLHPPEGSPAPGPSEWVPAPERWGLLSVAVAGLVAVGADPPVLECEWMADALSGHLAEQPGLLVVSRLSTPSSKVHGRDPRQLCSLLKVAYLVHGTVWRDGHALMLALQVLDGRDGSTTMDQVVRCRLADLLQDQDEGLDEVVQRVTATLVHREVKRAISSPLPHLKSYSILLGALHLMHRTSASDYQRAFEMLSYLTERHPESVAAKAWLAKWHVLRAPQGWSDDPKADAVKAQQLTRSALDREPTHALSLAVEGFARAYFHKDHEGALQRYGAALSANPNESLAWLLRSAVLSYQGQVDEAIDSCARAQRISPLDPLRYFYDHFTSGAFLAAGLYAQAVAFGERSRRANCMHASTLRVLAIAQMLDGREASARDTVRQLLNIEPGLTVRAFQARFPGKDAGQVRLFSEALLAGGVPA